MQWFILHVCLVKKKGVLDYAGLIDNPGDLSESIMSYEHYEEMRPVVYNSTIGYVVGTRWYSYNPVIATNATNESTSSTGE